MRRRRVYSRGELAARIGVGMEEMAAIERGAATPAPIVMARILYALDMTPDWLFFLTDVDTNERMDGIIRMVRCLDGTRWTTWSAA